MSAISSRIGWALPRQYFSPFGASSPSPFWAGVGPGCFLLSVPTTETPSFFIPERSSSVKTLPCALAAFLAFALRAASATESCFSEPAVCDCAWGDGFCDEDCAAGGDCWEDEADDCPKEAATGQANAERA